MLVPPLLVLLGVDTLLIALSTVVFELLNEVNVVASLQYSTTAILSFPVGSPSNIVVAKSDAAFFAFFNLSPFMLLETSKTNTISVVSVSVVVTS